VSIPKLPEEAPELCALKAYIMWEHAGMPDRDGAEEDREYQRGIEELNAELRAGLSLQVLSLYSEVGPFGTHCLRLRFACELGTTFRKKIK